LSNNRAQKKTINSVSKLCASYRIFSPFEEEEEEERTPPKKISKKKKTPKSPISQKPAWGEFPRSFQSFQVIRIMVVFVFFPIIPFLLGLEKKKLFLLYASPQEMRQHMRVCRHSLSQLSPRLSAKAQS
jgi:hypothetical protein